MKEEVFSILLEASVSYQDVYEITYVNKAKQKKVFHIYDVEFSLKKDTQKSSLIKAFTLEFKSEEKTSFSCSNIISITKYWKSIIDKDETAPEDGLYVFTCRGDNHLEEEIYHLNKGDRLYKYFDGENKHMNGWFEVLPLAFHYIKPYNTECSKWQDLNCIKGNENNLFIAVTKPNSSIEKDTYYRETRLKERCYFVFYSIYQYAFQG